MFRRNVSQEERLLGRLLERDAVEARPGFSESLHRRTMSAAKRRLAAAPTDPLCRSCVSRRSGLHSALPRLFAPLENVRFVVKGLRRLKARTMAVCAAAAVSVAFVLAIGWPMPNSTRHVPVPENPQVVRPRIGMPSIGDLADHTVARLDGAAVSAAFEPEMNRLKRDAHSIAGMFLDRLPIDATLLADNQQRKQQQHRAQHE
jgi:hypothetical protein